MKTNYNTGEISNIKKTVKQYIKIIEMRINND